jgi:Tol biopolymer transport system component
MTPSRQQRRAAERRGQRPRARWPLAMTAAAGVAVGGFFVWQYVASLPATRQGAPAWSPDSRRIVYFAERDNGKADLFVMDADGAAARPLLETPDADEGAPAMSPDGTRVAFDSDRDGNFELYVMDADASNVRRLTSHPGRDLAPAWSPDGSRIAFMSDRAGQGFDVHWMRPDGSGVERLTTTGSSWFPQFSPDGRFLAMHVHRDVHLLDLATRALRRLTVDPQNGMYPSWSNDGRLAFMSWRNGRTELFTMRDTGEDQQLLVTMPRGGAIDPRWSPDSRKIVFVHTSESMPDQPQTGDQWRVLYTLDLETRRLTRLSR